MCADPAPWQGHPLLTAATPIVRQQTAQSFLDFMRRALAIDARCLQEDEQREWLRRVEQQLKEPWSLDQNERLQTAGRFIVGAVTGEGESSLSGRSTLGRYLRSRRAWSHLAANLTPEEYDAFLPEWLAALQGGGFLTVEPWGDGLSVQLQAGALLWQRGNGQGLEPDPVRSRWLRSTEFTEREREANRFFRDFYRQEAARIGPMEGREHTGQVSQQNRIEREDNFREGRLPLLFCSPTMELGIDIKDLNAAHMRNVPPSPANYAQRSGRAGRSGQPAVIVTYCAVGSGHDQYFFRRPVDMVSGVVAPPRLDLSNEELIRAHIHAIWLAKTGLALGSSIIERAVDAATPTYPLQADVKHYTTLPDKRLQECWRECHHILAADLAELSQSSWYSDDWLWQTLRQAVEAFDRAFDRWREMYAEADRQLQAAREVIDRSYYQKVSNRDKQLAERQEREARRQKDLLCNLEGAGESDFYPYRYLASEGFLPGYNFPRLPLRAYIPGGVKEGEYINRPRFLALSEFGPHNVIYHEGRKYRVNRSQIPGGDAEARFVRAKLCHTCGTFHTGDDILDDCCHYCNTPLNDGNSIYTGDLFEMTDVVVRRVERITCDEEERVREGYQLTSHFRLAADDSGPRAVQATINGTDDAPLFWLTYGPAASLWRINHGWKRSQPQEGFALDLNQGLWVRRANEMQTDEDDDDQPGPKLRRGVRLLVRDTRNILLLHPTGDSPPDEPFLASLQAALLRAMEIVFQIDEGELAAERIGQGTHQGLLFWEAAEGGLGILGRLVTEPNLIAEIAGVALALIHFTPEGDDQRPPEDEANGCARACYDCLLSYTNQPDHIHLNRHLLRKTMLQLATSRVQRLQAGRDRDEHYRWLRERTDPASDLERKFLDFLYQSGRKLPDEVQVKLPDLLSQPDFYYNRGKVCVLCHGSVHDSPEQQIRDQQTETELVDLGYRVIVIRYDQPFETQVAHYTDTFGGNPA